MPASVTTITLQNSLVLAITLISHLMDRKKYWLKTCSQKMGSELGGVQIQWPLEFSFLPLLYCFIIIFSRLICLIYALQTYQFKIKYTVYEFFLKVSYLPFLHFVSAKKLTIHVSLLHLFFWRGKINSENSLIYQNIIIATIFLTLIFRVNLNYIWIWSKKIVAFKIKS